MSTQVLNPKDVKIGQGSPPQSSSGNQPANGGQPNNPPANAGVAGGEGGGQPSGGEGGGDGKMVPYSRFKEVNDELATLKAKQSASDLANSEKGNKPKSGEQPPVTAGQPEGQPAGNGEGNQPAQGSDDIASKIGKIAPVLKQHGFITREDQEADARVAEAKVMMKNHTGSDGLPAFDIDGITKFMKERRFYGSYDEAYKMLHHEAIVAKAVKDALEGNAGQSTIQGGKAFGSAPTKDAVTREGIAKMPLDQYVKMGGAKALKKAVIHGQVQ